MPLVTTTLTSAEMIKYAANTFLAMKIGFANEMANLCERVGADATEVMAGIGLDSRIGARFLNAGLGWGGSCFGKDIQSLLHTAEEYGYQARLLEAALAVNRAQRQVVIQKLQEKLFILKGPDDRAAGPGIQAGYRRPARCAQPADCGAAGATGSASESLRSHRHAGVPRAESRPEDSVLRIGAGCGMRGRCRGAGDGVGGVPASWIWRRWRALMQQPVLVDGRNLYDPETARSAGLDYTGIGRGGRPRYASARAGSNGKVLAVNSSAAEDSLVGSLNGRSR